MSKEDECVICSHKFDNPWKFPKDFPKEWRMCCLCRTYARQIIDYDTVEIYINGWISIIKKDRKETFIKTIRKINKLISLN